MMLSGIAVCSPRLSRKMYLHGVVDGALQSGTMWMPVVLVASIGVFRLSASGCAPTAELDSVGPSSARTWFCWISDCVFCEEIAWSEVWSSSVRSLWGPL